MIDDPVRLGNLPQGLAFMTFLPGRRRDSAVQLTSWVVAKKRRPICRVIFDKMQGGPTHFIAESHCAVRSWKNFSLKQEQGEAKRDCREEQGCKGAGYRELK